MKARPTRPECQELFDRMFPNGLDDPGESLQRELEHGRRAAELSDMRASLDRDYQRSVEEARRGAPPAIVRSYRRVYGRFPTGWPPS